MSGATAATNYKFTSNAGRKKLSSSLAQLDELMGQLGSKLSSVDRPSRAPAPDMTAVDTIPQPPLLRKTSSIQLPAMTRGPSSSLLPPSPHASLAHPSSGGLPHRARSKSLPALPDRKLDQSRNKLSHFLGSLKTDITKVGAGNEGLPVLVQQVPVSSDAMTRWRLETRHVVDCGVSLAFLLEFVDKVPGDFTTTDVVQNIVVPRTRPSLCRYVDLIPHHSVGPPTCFVSHAWGNNFRELVRKIAHHFGVLLPGQADTRGGDATEARTPRPVPQVLLWLDIFAINQHPGQVQAGDLRELKLVIGNCSKVLLVLDSQGVTLTRVWCLYECWRTVMSGGPRKLVVLADELGLPELEAIYFGVNASKATATKVEDLVRISGDIERRMGLRNLDFYIRRAIVQSVAFAYEQVREQLQQELGAAVAAMRYALILNVAAQHAKAGEVLDKAVQAYRSQLAPDHPTLLEALQLQSSTLASQGRSSEAREIAEQVLKLRQANVGAARGVDAGAALRALAQAQANLGEVLSSMGRQEEADQLHAAALQTFGKAFPSGDHECMAECLQHVALKLLSKGDGQEAQRLCQRALDALLGALVGSHVRVLRARRSLLYCGEGGSKGRETLRQYKQLLQVFDATLGSYHPDTAQLLCDLGRVCLAEGRAEKVLSRLPGLQEQRGQQQPAHCISTDGHGKSLPGTAAAGQGCGPRA